VHYLNLKKDTRMLNVKKITLSLFVFAVASCGSAFAATATSDMAVSASVSASCTITAGALDFGSYDPVVGNATAALDGTATLTVACTNGSSSNITLGQGSNATSGSTDAVPARQMASGTDRLAYALYSEATRTTVWGNTSDTGLAHTGTGNSDSVTVYAAMNAGQNVPSGSYSDTVVATITF
jgi:spore coat protein U-like protein